MAGRKLQGHDWDGQRQETFDTFAEIGGAEDLPARAVVHFLFLAEDREPAYAAFGKALQDKGFRVEVDAEEGVVDAAFGPIPVTAASIWEKEREATEVALAHAFWPDGWDMLESGD